MAASAPNLHIELLGGFRIAVDGQPVTAGLTSRLRALIAYLAIHPDTAIPRQRLAFLFWTDSEEAQARTNLRQLLHHLRSALPQAELYLHLDHQALRWRPGHDCFIDVAAFQAAAAQGDLEIAAQLYRGDLLPALYDEWIETERDRLGRLYENVLDRLIAQAEGRRDFAAAIRFAEVRLARDTLREASYQTLMRLHALNGDRAGALRVYDRCADVLRRELDIEPGPATCRVRDNAMQIEAAPEPERAAPAPPRTARDTPLLGREPEFTELLTLWHRAAAGHPSIAVLTGEPGIGKTRLMDELLDRAAQERAGAARAVCYPGEHALAYSAVVDWLRTPAILSRVRELPAIQRSQLSRLLPELLVAAPDVQPPPPFTEAWQKRHFFAALAEAVRPQQTPLLFAIDDLQWCDAETIEWLQYLLRFDPSAHLFIVATMRTEEATEACLALLRQADEIALGPLDHDDTLRLGAHIAGRSLDTPSAESLHERTHGNPLFVVETVRAGWSAGDSVPPKVHAVITGRLHHLTAGAQELAAVAAVIDRPFTVDTAASVAGLPEDAVVQATDELWKHHILQQDETGTYDFSHRLLRDVAYDAIGPARRRQLHRRVAESLETSNAVEADAVCAQVATHYELAGLPQRAIRWYQRAAEVLQRRFAETEAIAYLSRALGLIETVPPSPDRDHLELDLLISYGLSLAETQGYASEETGKAYSRARMLCEVTHDNSRYFQVLAGSWSFHAVRGELPIAVEMAERYLALAHQNGDPMLLAAGNFCVGAGRLHRGLLQQAREHLESCCGQEENTAQSRRLYDFGPELGVFGRSYLAHLLWLTGDPDEALAQSRRAMARAESISHPFSLALALAYSAMLHHFRDEPEPAQERAEAVAAICRRYEFRYYLAWTPIIVGWARMRLGEKEAGLARMLEGYSELRATGAALRASLYLSLMAQGCAECGQVERGLQYLDEAMLQSDSSTETWAQPETQRIRGDLLRQLGREAEAVTCYRNAVRLAQQMGAQSWQRRAENSLARSALRAQR